MKVRVQKTTSSPSGLVVGLQIHGPKDSWLRFAQLEIPWEVVDEAWTHDWSRWFDRERVSRELPQEQPLGLDWA